MSEEHEFITKARRDLQIPDDKPFLEAFTEKWLLVSPDDRRRDLVQLDSVQDFKGNLRAETQLGNLRRRLRGIDERLRRVGS